MDFRDFGLFVATGLQGVGKTHMNLEMAYGYILDNMATGRKGRKVLIYNSSLDKMYQRVPIIQWQDIKRQPDRTVMQVQARKSNGALFTPEEKKKWLFYLFTNFSDGLLICEDFSNCVLNTKSSEFVGPLTTMRHKKADMYSDSGTDVLVSMQNMSKVTGDLWENISYYRMHKQTTSVYGQKDDISNFTLFQIAENIVETQFSTAEKAFRAKLINKDSWRAHRSYHAWVHVKGNKISNISKEDNFVNACAEVVRGTYGAIPTYCNKNKLNKNNPEHELIATNALIQPLFGYYEPDNTPPWQLNPSN